jgi:hypothetical protein
MRLKPAWTDEDNERLKAFVADGASLSVLLPRSIAG